MDRGGCQSFVGGGVPAEGPHPGADTCCLRRVARYRLSLLLADLAGAGFARGACRLESKLDGLRLPVAVSVRYHAGLAGLLLRAYDTGDVLVAARGHRGDRRYPRHG